MPTPSKLITLQQAVHGYRHGHDLIASSFPIAGVDAQTLLSLTDLSGPNPPSKLDSYLSGYPLLDLGYYAFSKTWIAREMPRAGCVWTHTIFVELSDLGTINHTAALQALFQRPTGNFDKGRYEVPIIVDSINDFEIRSLGIDFEICKKIISALYGRPDQKVFVAYRELDAADIALKIWTQQWPRLRRNFRFCTASLSDRSLTGHNFDLQFLSEFDSSARIWASRLGALVDQESVDPVCEDHDWVKCAVDDLAIGPDSNLRKFFKRFGADIEGDRKHFRPLSSIYLADLAHPGDHLSATRIIDVLRGNFPSPSVAKTLKSYLFPTLHTRNSESSWRRGIALLKAILLGPEPEQMFGSVEGASDWLKNIAASDPETVLEYIETELNPRFLTLNKSVIQLVVGAFAADDIIALGSKHPNFFIQAVSISPEIAHHASAWKLPRQLTQKIFAAVQNLKGNGYEISSAILDSGANEYAFEAVSAFGTSAILAFAKKIDENPRLERKHLESPWMAAALENPTDFGSVIVSGDISKTKTVVTFARAEYSIRKNYPLNCRIWLAAYRKASGKLDESDSIFFSSYLLALTLRSGTGKSDAEGVLKFAFDVVYMAADEVAPNTPEFDLLSGWIVCKSYWVFKTQQEQFIESVSDAYMHLPLSEEGFLDLTRFDTAFAELVSCLRQHYRGLKFLKRVLSIAEARPRLSGNTSTRRQVLKKAIAHWGYF